MAVRTAEAGTIRNVAVVSGDTNRVSRAVAPDVVLAGRQATALAGKPLKATVPEARFGSRLSAVLSRDRMSAVMQAAGPGARGIVFGDRPGAIGHVLGVINQNGTVRFLDGRIERSASLDGFGSLHLLRTN